MSPVVENLVVGILTSIITGVAVWLWQRTRQANVLNKKSRFFGVSSKEKCLLVMNRNPKNPASMSHDDIYALIEAAKIVNDLSGEIIIAPYDINLEGVGETVEFCIGGPDSNQRSRAHMERFFNKVYFKPYEDPDEPLALMVGEKKFIRKRNEQEYALLARIYPGQNSKPIFLICGQTAITNRGAMYFLSKNYNRLSKNIPQLKSFCLVMQVSEVKIYGHKMIDIIEDVTLSVIKNK